MPPIDILQEGIKLSGGSKQINEKWADILLKAMLEIPGENIVERMNFLDQPFGSIQVINLLFVTSFVTCEKPIRSKHWLRTH